MSKLISGKEAKLAWANGEKLEVNRGFGWEDLTSDYCLSVFGCDFPLSMRLKPRTITINGIEVPAPFNPKVGEEYWVLFDSVHSSDDYKLVFPETIAPKASIGKWRTEEEIKQVVAALRKVFEVQS